MHQNSYVGVKPGRSPCGLHKLWPTLVHVHIATAGCGIRPVPNRNQKKIRPGRSVLNAATAPGGGLNCVDPAVSCPTFLDHS